MQTKRENRGGRRPGSGRPSDTFSANRINKMLRFEQEYEKKYGKSVQEVLLDIIYGIEDEVTPRDKLAAAKIWVDKTHVEIKEGGETDKQLSAAPAVYLPQQRPDPVKLVK